MSKCGQSLLAQRRLSGREIVRMDDCNWADGPMLVPTPGVQCEAPKPTRRDPCRTGAVSRQGPLAATNRREPASRGGLIADPWPHHASHRRGHSRREPSDRAASVGANAATRPVPLIFKVRSLPHGLHADRNGVSSRLRCLPKQEG
jgi:hypothetical protein